MAEIFPQPNCSQEEATLYVDRMKKAITSSARKPYPACLTFTINYELRDSLRAAAAKHRMTMTQVLTYYIERVIPVLEKADATKESLFRYDPSLGRGRPA
jgi:hypothetical protein